jgi:hypothetical protein
MALVHGMKGHGVNCFGPVLEPSPSSRRISHPIFCPIPYHISCKSEGHPILFPTWKLSVYTKTRFSIRFRVRFHAAYRTRTVEAKFYKIWRRKKTKNIFVNNFVDMGWLVSDGKSDRESDGHPISVIMVYFSLSGVTSRAYRVQRSLVIMPTKIRYIWKTWQMTTVGVRPRLLLLPTHLLYHWTSYLAGPMAS